MFFSPKLRLEYKTYSHCISPGLSNVNRGSENIFEFQFIGLNGYDLNYRHIEDEFLRILSLKTIVSNVPLGALQVESLDVAAVLRLLFDFLRVFMLGNNRVKRAFIECPSLRSASGLHKCS